MKVLVLSDRDLQYEDGITIPLRRILKIMVREGHVVDIKVVTKKNGALDIIFDLLFIRPAWSFEFTESIDEYDKVIVSPLGVGYNLKNSVKKITILNDDLISVYRNRKDLSRFRIRHIDYYQCKIIKNSKAVLVQSFEDFRSLSSKYDSSNIFVASNGTEIKHENFEWKSDKNVIIWVGTYSGYYKEIVDQIVSLIDSYNWKYTTWKFFLKGDEPITHSDNVVFDTSYYEDKSEIYVQGNILIAPVFKGYGKINKVCEALSLGLNILSDTTAFNGLNFNLYNDRSFISNSIEGLIEKAHELDSSGVIMEKHNLTEDIIRDLSWENFDNTVIRIINDL